MTRRPAAWQPEWTVSPGEILADELELRGLSQSELARRMGRPVKTINEIVHAKAAVTPDTALQLELALDVPARLWLNLESSYREQLARERAFRSFADDTDWARRFPLADLRKYRLIPEAASGGELVAAVLGFFGVSSVESWDRLWSNPVADFRHSPTFESDSVALSAWLRWGERFAESVDTQPFDADKLRLVLVAAREFTRQEPLSDVLEDLSERLADCGVVLALTPGLKGTAVSGATRWLAPDRALIQLSMRYRSDDHLWFTLFHEASHLLEETHDGWIESDKPAEPTDELERRVDQRARDLLVPPREYDEFVQAGEFDIASARSFAKTIRVASGIVAGRLEHDGHVAPGKLARLKKPVRWQT